MTRHYFAFMLARLLGVLGWMALLLILILLYAPTAKAQMQPGPNIAPNGVPFTFSPRFGYLGPPAGFALYPSPPRPRYNLPQSMPTIPVPREPAAAPPVSAYGMAPPAPAAAPPMRQSLPGATQAPPGRRNAPLPSARARPPVPCPAGCPREADSP